MTKKGRIVLISDSHGEAEHFAQVNGIDRNRWTRATDERALLGQKDAVFIVFPSAVYLPGYRQMIDRLAPLVVNHDCGVISAEDYEYKYGSKKRGEKLQKRRALETKSATIRRAGQ